MPGSNQVNFPQSPHQSVHQDKTRLQLSNSKMIARSALKLSSSLASKSKNLSRQRESSPNRPSTSSKIKLEWRSTWGKRSTLSSKIGRSPLKMTKSPTYQECSKSWRLLCTSHKKWNRKDPGAPSWPMISSHACPKSGQPSQTWMWWDSRNPRWFKTIGI